MRPSRLRSRLRAVLAALLLAISATVAIATATTGSAGASPEGSRPPDPVADAAQIHRLVFDTSLAEFAAVAATHQGGDDWLDWSTDWCSAPLVGSTGKSFDFRLPCRRHDFAYRNTRLLDIRYGCPSRPAGEVCAAGTWSYGRYWGFASRLAIDLQFRRDMRTACWTRPLHQWPRCLAWSEVFYRAVRVAGGP